MHQLKKGDKVLVIVEATVLTDSNSHGQCFEVELDKRDYSHPRTIWVDPDEITIRLP